ncbi:hypothetical protein ACT4ML_15820 [Natrinema sp. LN54]|uniref:hypothetical protein n=1 Tax=Natrinema sp. LN54 TaxID=3458705 RepID=UPI004036AE3A
MPTLSGRARKEITVPLVPIGELFPSVGQHLEAVLDRDASGTVLSAVTEDDSRVLGVEIEGSLVVRRFELVADRTRSGIAL